MRKSSLCLVSRPKTYTHQHHFTIKGQIFEVRQTYPRTKTFKKGINQIATNVFINSHADSIQEKG